MLGILVFECGRHCGKVFPEPAVLQLFLSACTHKEFFSTFFSWWLLVNNSRYKRASAFLLCFTGFETINFYIFFIKSSYFQTNSFKNKELLTITQIADMLLYSSDSWNSVQNFKANGRAVLVLALGEHDSLWLLLILFLVQHQNSPVTPPLIC